MCGIVGILGTRPVAPLIVDALKRLEYRGYDSAGVATIEGDHLDRRRAEGKLVNLEERIKDAMTAAGSVVTSDVPDEALVVARAQQKIIDGLALKLRKRNEAIKKSKKS